MARSAVVMLVDAPPFVDFPPTARVEPGGAFAIESAPPGRYTAFAVQSDRAAELRGSAELRKRLERYGERVEVKPGETTTVELEMVPEDAFDGR